MEIEKIADEDILKSSVKGFEEEANREKNILETGFQPFAYAAKNDNRKIVEGIRDWRIFGEIYEDKLCLQKEIVEKEMNQCDSISLYTNHFQETVKFHEKCGFKFAFVRRNGKNIIRKCELNI
ncbi:MAG: hypothetical protein LBR92_03350 [Puniceicoccales bacterium]|nr:hypothetical protein [Puniceicoccales bacterium]